MLKTLITRSAILTFACSLSISTCAMADGAKRSIHIPSGDLAVALELLAKQSGAELVYRPDQVQGFKTDGIEGEVSTEEAVTKLLKGTPLTLSVDSSGAMLIALPTRTDSAQTQKIIELEEIAVTGTRIRGAQLASPLLSLGREDMRLAGQNNLGEAVRALPQNFSGGQNPGVGLDAVAGAPANANITGGSSINLRGLGPDATLTLLNGARLPYNGIYQAVDVSAIPMAAISRIEILLDGASAIYGSDAVGGVANVILRRDLDGAELSARYGSATDGGYEQQQYSGVLGRVWSSGNMLVAFDHSDNGAVRARDRDYLGYLPHQDVTIYPELEQLSLLFSARQELGDNVELALDAIFNDREQDAVLQNSASVFVTNAPSVTSWAVSPSLTVDWGDWAIRLHGALGRNETESRQRNFSMLTGLQTASFDSCYCNSSEGAGLETEGPVFTLPGGSARLSVGGGYRRNTLETINYTTGQTDIDGADRSAFAYAEVNLPLIGPAQQIPWVSRLSLSGAVRYEDYRSFGDTTTPKFGVAWTVAPGFDVRASWGRSFKVPTLEQQNAPSQVYLMEAPATAPAGSTILFDFGGNPALGPERAEILTLGFVVSPSFAPGLVLEAGWFDVDYTDRVTQPLTPLVLALSDPGNPLFSEFVTFDPSAADQQSMIDAATYFFDLTGGGYDPSNVYAALHNRNFNAAAQQVSGFDLTASYTTRLGSGELLLSLNGNWIDGERQLTRTQPVLPASGTVYFPPDFRARAGATWSWAGFTVSSFVNHLDGVTNTTVTPNTGGDAMTTVDLVFDYAVATGGLAGVRFNLALTNAFDQAPPRLHPLQSYWINYDSTNYNALGRVISFQVSKSW